MERLIELLQEIRVDVDFKKEKNLVKGSVLDSFDIIQIITMIDEEYDVNVPATEIIPENFNDVESIYKLIQRFKEE